MDNPMSDTDMLRKAIAAERASIVTFLRSHADVPIGELADALAAGAHLRDMKAPALDRRRLVMAR